MSAFRVMAAVRGRPSGLPGSCISGFSACAQLPPIRLRTNVAALIGYGSLSMHAMDLLQSRFIALLVT
ncbi:hypothetical protein, partial [Vibrio vulnificus]|uniref:hypothetical protein n=1 Tax=Vibrio vulnificus TaxID=672 RepID=UPI0039B3F6B5